MDRDFSAARYGLAILLSAPLLVWSGFAALVLGVFAKLACDESCSSRTDDWGDTEDAWQWSALGWLGLALAIAAAGFVLLVATNRRRPAFAVLFAHALVAAVAFGIMRTSQRVDPRAPVYAIVFASELAAVVAAALLVPRR